jgi:hypothetical protein
MAVVDEYLISLVRIHHQDLLRAAGAEPRAGRRTRRIRRFELAI